ncbi:MAG: single-stranded DNA-binding protein [Neisseriaceae bacterium]|nr:MAG: single-stranded DNA-binding protein [Neisseriaceae bacterium]
MFRCDAIGNLTRDAEWKAGKFGDFLAFDVAVNFGKDKTQYVSCTLSSVEYANKLMPYMKKGTRIFVTGLPAVDTYNSRDGSVKPIFKMFANSIEFVGSKKDNTTPPESESNSNSTDNFNAPGPVLTPDDVPF